VGLDPHIGDPTSGEVTSRDPRPKCGTTTLLVQEFHKAKKMTSNPAIKAQKKEKKQELDLLQHKRETNFSEKLDQQRVTVLNS
jgi:hypothetical protein